MIMMNVNDTRKNKIETFPYKGKPYEVRNVWIQWLSQTGPQGSPDYGLRFFTIGARGEIPIHNHSYVQTMYILSGQIAVASHDLETDDTIEEKILGPNDFVFIPSMEPHSMRNLSDEEDVTFLCCIANIHEDQGI